MMLAMTIHVINYSGFTRLEKGWYVGTFVAIMLLLLIPCMFISKVDPADTVRVR
jgi:hypothetical protein